MQVQQKGRMELEQDIKVRIGRETVGGHELGDSDNPDRQVKSNKRAFF